MIKYFIVALVMNMPTGQYLGIVADQPYATLQECQAALKEVTQEPNTRSFCAMNPAAVEAWRQWNLAHGVN